MPISKTKPKQQNLSQTVHKTTNDKRLYVQDARDIYSQDHVS